MASLSWSDRTRVAKKTTPLQKQGTVSHVPPARRAGLLLMALLASAVFLFTNLMHIDAAQEMMISPPIATTIALVCVLSSTLMLLLRFAATKSASRAALTITALLSAIVATIALIIGPFFAVYTQWSLQTLQALFAVLFLLAIPIEMSVTPVTKSRITWMSILGTALAAGTLGLIFTVRIHVKPIGILSAPLHLGIALLMTAALISLLRRKALRDEFSTMLVMLALCEIIGELFLSFAITSYHPLSIGGYVLVLMGYALPALYLQMGMFTTYRYSEQYRLKGREMAIGVQSGQELSPIVFREIAKQITDPLAITDTDGRILFANKALAQLSGIEQKLLIGMLPSQWLHISMPHDVYPKLFKTVREKRETMEISVKNAVNTNPKKSYDALVRVTPVLDEFGDIACTIMTQRNLSAEQEQTNILRQIINTIPLGVILLDAKDLTLTLVNVQAEYLLGRAGIDLSSVRTFTALASHIQTQDGKPYAEDRLPPIVTRQTGKSAEAKDLALFAGTDNTPTMIWSMHAVPFLNTEGALQTILVSFEDIREHQEYDHRMTDFISVASHQLRTPLTGIKWSLDELRKKQGTMSPDDQTIIFETCFEASDRMMVTLQQLLQVAELESGTTKRKGGEAIDLKQAVEDAVKALKPHLDKKQLHFKQSVLKSLPLLHADRFLFMQVLQNILENAIKYTPENGEIDSILTVKENKISWVLHDTGIGIAKKDLPQVFDKFFRTDNAQKMVPDGTGLGLYIVQSIIDRMGGSVAIESEEGRGTTVEVLLPIG